MKKRFGGLSLLALGFCSAAQAQNTTAQNTTAQNTAAQATPTTPPQEASVPVAAPASAAADDIVVTAQKRSESLQRVPIAITAVTTTELQRSGISDIQSLTKLVPNLYLGENLGAARIAIRGVGLEALTPGAEGSVAFHIDGVYISRPIAALASFYDVKQVEAVRGPQGTLYGRNATGGTINLITAEPTEELSGYANLTVGNYDLVRAQGAISGAIVPGLLSARIAFQTENHAGYGKNIVTGHDIDDRDSRAVRGKLLFTPANRLRIEISGDYYHRRDASGGYHFLGAGGFSAPGVPVTPTGIALGGYGPDRIRDLANDYDPHQSVEAWGVSGKAIYDITGDISLTSLTAFRKTDYVSIADIDGTSAYTSVTEQNEHDRQFSQELQLSGKTADLTWLLGFFYFNENDRGAIVLPLSNATVGVPAAQAYNTQGYFAGGRIRTDAIAVFGQATYEIVPRLRLTLGGRYSTEKKYDNDEFLFDVLTPYDPRVPLNLIRLNRSVRFNAFTPRVAADFQASQNLLIYGSWSRGFKSGTYNLGGLQDPVKPEKVSAFEAGVKSTTLDGRLRLNLAGFYYDYSDLQVGKVVNASLALENAATARIYGIEAEGSVKLTDRFSIDANASWLHARFTKFISADPARPFGDGRTIDGGVPAFDLSGNTLSQAPDFTAFAGAQYAIPARFGGVSIRGEVSWRDRIYFTPFNVKYVSQPQNTKLNAFVNWQSNSGKYNASLFAKNITNRTTISNAIISSSLFGFPINAFLDEPRTYGISFGHKF